MEDPRAEYAAKLTAAVRAAGREPVRPVEIVSQYGEDTFIWNVLNGQLDGFYIEVGAFDGYHFSVTYALECIGWKGLLIEAIPERYEECVLRRPDARVVHAALGEPGPLGRTTEFTVTEDRWGGMLSSVGRDGGLADPSAVASKRVVQVPLRTMDELLDGHTGDIDVAVLDVEGHEVPLLKGFDLERWRPKLLIIEDGEGDTALARYMAGTTYISLGRMSINRVYARRDAALELSKRM